MTQRGTGRVELRRGFGGPSEALRREYVFLTLIYF